MTSFSHDPAAVERMRARVGAPVPSGVGFGGTDPSIDPAGDPAGDPSGEGETDADPDLVPSGAVGWFEGDDWSSRVRSFGRRLVAPAERRFRVEVERAVERHDTDLAHQVEELRAELIRTRSAHAAEIAALNEQLRGRS